MKLLRLIALASVLALLAAPRSAAAQLEVELVPFAGGTFFLADPPHFFAIERGNNADPVLIHNGAFDDAFTMGLTAALRFESGFAIEGMISWLPTALNASSGIAHAVDVQSFMYAGSVVYHLPFETVVRPFLGVGVGGESFAYDPEGWQGHTDWMGNVLGGVVIPMNDRIGLRLEARDCITWFESHVLDVDDKAQNDLMITAGLSLGFPLGR